MVFYRYHAKLRDLESHYDRQASELRAAFVSEVAALYGHLGFSAAPGPGVSGGSARLDKNVFKLYIWVRQNLISLALCLKN
jgi:hypothetical protein